ncbi:MAG: isochorismatase family protein [Limnohabitans sp.]
MSMHRDDIYRQQGLGGTSGMGRRCGLILVDFVNAFVDVHQLGGPHIEAAAHASVALLHAFRQLQLPVAHSRVVFAEDGSDINVFAKRIKPLQQLTEHAHSSHIVKHLQPVAGEMVVRKQTASAFFNTPLADWLHLHAVDTAVVAGCTTSGCVRATVVDAMQHNFRTIVVSDCVGDRAIEPHEANMFDMQQKYADVMARDILIASLLSAEKGHAHD